MESDRPRGTGGHLIDPHQRRLKRLAQARLRIVSGPVVPGLTLQSIYRLQLDLEDGNVDIDEYIGCSEEDACRRFCKKLAGCAYDLIIAAYRAGVEISEEQKPQSRAVPDVSSLGVAKELSKHGLYVRCQANETRLGYSVILYRVRPYRQLDIAHNVSPTVAAATFYMKWRTGVYGKANNGQSGAGDEGSEDGPDSGRLRIAPGTVRAGVQDSAKPAADRRA